MTYEKALFKPKPDLGSSKNRLIERKQMSTKTTFKRVALVAVAALGLGLLSAVSAQATANDFVSLSAGTPNPARVGVVSGMTTITGTFTTAGADTVTAQITSAPATSTKAGLTIGALTSSAATGYVAVSSGRVSSTVNAACSRYNSAAIIRPLRSARNNGDLHPSIR